MSFHQRKLSNPPFGTGAYPNGGSYDSSSSGLNLTSSKSQFLLSLLATPTERIALQKKLSYLKLVSPPQYDPASTSSTAPGTPFQSNPSTPLTGAGPLSFTEAKPPSVLAKEVQRNLPPLASKAAWFHDDAIPLTTRTATRAFLLGYTLNSALETLLPAILGKKR